MSDEFLKERLQWIETRLSEIEFRLRRIEEMIGIQRGKMNSISKRVPDFSMQIIIFLTLFLPLILFVIFILLIFLLTRSILVL